MTILFFAVGLFTGFTLCALLVVGTWDGWWRLLWWRINGWNKP